MLVTVPTYLDGKELPLLPKVLYPSKDARSKSVLVMNDGSKLRVWAFFSYRYTFHMDGDRDESVHSYGVEFHFYTNKKLIPEPAALAV